MNTKELLNEIEYKICKNEMTKEQVFTQMKQIIQSLERSDNKDCAVPSPFETTPKSCATCNSKGMDAYECYCCKQNELCYYEAQDFAQS